MPHKTKSERKEEMNKVCPHCGSFAVIFDGRQDYCMDCDKTIKRR